MPQTPTLLSSGEVCDILRIDRSTLSRWVKFGDIAVAHRLPGKTGAMLFDPAEVARFAAERAAS